MRKVWIDIVAAKDVRYFKTLRDRASNMDFFFTARKHAEIYGMLKMWKLKHKIIGSHGGPTLEGKLIASANRTFKLSKLISNLEKRPDVFVSFSSPEGCRVAFGLRIPIICLNDTPHAVHVARLTLPLADKVIVPAAIGKERFIELGAREEAIIEFNGVDEVAWVKDFQPDTRVMEKLDLSPTDKIVVVRPEEAFAAYLTGKVKLEDSPSIKIIERLLSWSGDAKIVVLPRYKEQKKVLVEKFRRKVKIPSKTIDALSLVAFSEVVLTGGGTLGREAALMGIPAISYFPGEQLDVNAFLIRRGFPLWEEKNPERAADIALEILSNPDSYKRDVSSLIEDLEDPIDVIIKTIEEITE